MRSVTREAGGDARAPIAACVGIDWAKDSHLIALRVEGGEQVEVHTLEHSPQAIQSWLSTLTTRFGAAPIAVAVETSRGPLVHALLEAPQVQLYPVNPRALCRYREAFTPNGAKDDAPDARLLLDLACKHRDQLVRWCPQRPEYRELDRLVQFRRTMVGERTRLSQRLQDTLEEYFPLALDVVGDDVTSAMACALLKRWPTFERLTRARRSTLEQFYRDHNCRSAGRIAHYLACIAAAVPLTTDRAIIDSSALLVSMLTGQLRVIADGIAELDHAIADRFAQIDDATLFTALPGAGAVLAPRLLVALGDDRARFPTADALAQTVGIAPITVRSGRSHQVRWRWMANTFLRQTFHEFAQHSIQHCAWARAYFALQRARGKPRHTAFRALAFKWIRVIWRCWQDSTPYDDARHMRTLIERGSPLVAYLKPEAIPAAA